MAKKKINQKVSKSEPVHYKNLNLNKKIISIVLIVLAIGVIGSVFPGDMTGGAISDLMLNTFNNGDYIISAIFGRIGIDRDNIFVYEKFVLFLLLFTILSVGLKTLQIKGMQNFVIAGAISLISSWFIPESVLAMIGLTYSSVYASFLILVPVLIVGTIIWKIEPSKGGYAVKSVMSLILAVIFAATKEGIETKYPLIEIYWFKNFSDIIIVVLFILAAWYLIKVFTVTPEDQTKGHIKEQIDKSADNFSAAAARMLGRIGDKGTSKLDKLFKE